MLIICPLDILQQFLGLFQLVPVAPKGAFTSLLIILVVIFSNAPSLGGSSAKLNVLVVVFSKALSAGLAVIVFFSNTPGLGGSYDNLGSRTNSSVFGFPSAILTKLKSLLPSVIPSPHWFVQ